MRRLMKKGSEGTKRAPIRSRARPAKAASISPLVLALMIWIGRDMARAVASTSFNAVSPLCGGRIGERGHARGCRYELAQQRQPLRPQFTDEIIGAGRVAARPGEVRDETNPHRVFANGKDNGN